MMKEDWKVFCNQMVISEDLWECLVNSKDTGEGFVKDSHSFTNLR